MEKAIEAKTSAKREGGILKTLANRLIERLNDRYDNRMLMREMKKAEKEPDATMEELMDALKR
jgi:hypothetical protein